MPPAGAEAGPASCNRMLAPAVTVVDCPATLLATSGSKRHRTSAAQDQTSLEPCGAENSPGDCFPEWRSSRAGEPHHQGRDRQDDDPDQLRRHLADVMDAYYFGRRLKTQKRLTPYGFIVKCGTSEHERFRFDPTLQMPGPNTRMIAAGATSPAAIIRMALPIPPGSPTNVGGSVTVACRIAPTEGENIHV